MTSKNSWVSFDYPIDSYIAGDDLIEAINNCSKNWNVPVEDISLDVNAYDYSAEVSLSTTRMRTDREEAEYQNGLAAQREKSREYKLKQLEALKKELGMS